MKTEQYLAIVKRQDQLNNAIGTNWRQHQRQWYRAIWLECAEVFDHLDWKWWKKQNSNWGQIHMELVDILHFGVSDLLQRTSDYNQVVQTLQMGLAHQKSQQQSQTDFKDKLEQFVTQVLANQAFVVAAFGELCRAANLSNVQIFQLYMGKNILNAFRQNHGYKQGTYQKIWNQKEDNEYLMDIVKTQPIDDADYENKVYMQLEAQYQKCVK